jgi:hypothetical protein
MYGINSFEPYRQIENQTSYELSPPSIWQGDRKLDILSNSPIGFSISNRTGEASLN